MMVSFSLLYSKMKCYVTKLLKYYTLNATNFFFLVEWEHDSFQWKMLLAVGFGEEPIAIPKFVLDSN